MPAMAQNTKTNPRKKAPDPDAPASSQTIEGQLAAEPKPAGSRALILAGCAGGLALLAAGLAGWQMLRPPLPDWQEDNRAELARLSGEITTLQDRIAAEAEQGEAARQALGQLTSRIEELRRQLAAETSQREALASQLEEARAQVRNQAAQNQAAQNQVTQISGQPPDSQLAARPASRLLLDELWLASQSGADLTGLAQLIGRQTDALAAKMAGLLGGTLTSHAALLAEGEALLEEARSPASDPASLVTDALAGIWNRLADTVRVRELASDEGPLAAGQAEFTQLAKTGDLAAAVQLVARSEALDQPDLQDWLARAEARLATDAAIAALHARQNAAQPGEKSREKSGRASVTESDRSSGP